MSTLLLIGAVPFQLGPVPKPSNNNRCQNATTRRRHPAGNSLVLPATPAVPDLHEILRSPEGAGFVSVGLDLAGRSLGGNGPDGVGAALPPPGPPPNSPADDVAAAAPSGGQNVQRFVFPDVPEDEDSSSSCNAVKVSHTQQQQQRKRRRVPSFNKTHRVAPKVKAAVASDADDEASDECHEAASSHGYDSDSEARQELSLRLQILAESQKAANRDTDWSRVGSELRSIADTFQSMSATSGSGPNGHRNQDRDQADRSGQSSDVVPTDLLSFINLLLPVSIPQSLWSAIASYVAWKILKRL